MRRPQTKQPYAFRRKATRTQGRPVHRIYSATPRPPMHGRIIVVETAAGTWAFIITFEHNFYQEQWWVVGGDEGFCTDRANQMLSSPHPGAVYNAFNYGLAISTFTDWTALGAEPNIEFSRFIVSSDPPGSPTIDSTF